MKYIFKLPHEIKPQIRIMRIHAYYMAIFMEQDTIQFQLYLITNVQSMASSFPCHWLFELKFQHSSHWSAAQNYPLIAFPFLFTS